MNKAIVIFGDNNKVCLEIKNKLYEKKHLAEPPILAGHHPERDILKVVDAAHGKQIVLVFKNEDLKDITELFYESGVQDIFVCPWDTHYIDKVETTLADCLFPIDNTKPRLNYVEFELSEGCNLNCKGCFQYSNLAKNNKFPDIHVFKRDLKKLKDFFWGIGKIRLQGGEPLLNPDFLSFVSTAREVFPDCDLRLVSNGLLIPTLDHTQLSVVKQNNCSFDISNYPPTQKKIKLITKHLDDAGVSYNISLPVKVFFKGLSSKPAETPVTSFNNCIFTHCHALANGHLAACTHQFYVDRLNTAFCLNYPADEPDEVIDIFNTTLNGWEINKIFENPRDFCRYCSAGMVPFKWKPAQKGKAKADDWIVKNTFLHVIFGPLVQKAMKSFANRLRYLNQRPKRKQ